MYGMMSVKVVAVTPITNVNLLVFFETGEIKKFDVKPIMEDYPEFRALYNEELFKLVKVEPGGYGISWNEDLDCSEGELYENGTSLPLTVDDFVYFGKHNIINTAEAAEILGCTRQNIGDLIQRRKIEPVKSYAKCTLFLKEEIERRTWGEKL